MGWNPFKEAVNLVKDVSGFSLAEDLYGGLSGKDAAEAARQAGEVQAGAAMSAAEVGAQSQREVLDYYKQRESMPMQYRDQALAQQAEFYMPGGEPQSVDQMIQSIMGGEQFGALQGMGEQAIMRNASATGGLRSGNTQQNLAQNDQQLMMQLLQQRMGGIQNLAGLQGMGKQIGGTMGNIGAAQQQGILGAGNAQAQSGLAAAQAQQQGMGNMLNLGLGVAGLFV